MIYKNNSKPLFSICPYFCATSFYMLLSTVFIYFKSCCNNYVIKLGAKVKKFFRTFAAIKLKIRLINKKYWL